MLKLSNHNLKIRLKTSVYGKLYCSNKFTKIKNYTKCPRDKIV